MVSLSIERKPASASLFYNFEQQMGSFDGSKNRFGGSVVSLSLSNQSGYDGIYGFPEMEQTSPTSLEDEFCRNFNCCGIQLNDMHDLLRHSEECHKQEHHGHDDEMMGQCGDVELPFPLDLQSNFEELEVDLLDRSKSPFLFMNNLGQQKTLSMQDIYCETITLERPALKQPTPFHGRTFLPQRQNAQTWFTRVESTRTPVSPLPSQHQQPQPQPQLPPKPLVTKPSRQQVQEEGNREYLDPPRPSQRISGDRHCNTCRSKKTSKWYKDHVDIGKYICKTCYNQIYKERNKWSDNLQQ